MRWGASDAIHTQIHTHGCRFTRTGGHGDVPGSCQETCPGGVGCGVTDVTRLDVGFVN